VFLNAWSKMRSTLAHRLYTPTFQSDWINHERLVNPSGPEVKPDMPKWGDCDEDIRMAFVHLNINVSGIALDARATIAYLRAVGAIMSIMMDSYPFRSIEDERFAEAAGGMSWMWWWREKAASMHTAVFNKPLTPDSRFFMSSQTWATLRITYCGTLYAYKHFFNRGGKILYPRKLTTQDILELHFGYVGGRITGAKTQDATAKAMDKSKTDAWNRGELRDQLYNIKGSNVEGVDKLYLGKYSRRRKITSDKNANK